MALKSLVQLRGTPLLTIQDMPAPLKAGLTRVDRSIREGSPALLAIEREISDKKFSDKIIFLSGCYRIGLPIPPEHMPKGLKVNDEMLKMAVATSEKTPHQVEILAQGLSYLVRKGLASDPGFMVLLCEASRHMAGQGPPLDHTQTMADSFVLLEQENETVQVGNSITVLKDAIGNFQKTLKMIKEDSKTDESSRLWTKSTIEELVVPKETLTMPEEVLMMSLARTIHYKMKTIPQGLRVVYRTMLDQYYDQIFPFLPN